MVKSYDRKKRGISPLAPEGVMDLTHHQFPKFVRKKIYNVFATTTEWQNKLKLHLFI